jgi:hypothetical protein
VVGDPAIDLTEVESEQPAPLHEGDATLDDQSPHMTDLHAEIAGNSLYVDEASPGIGHVTAPL